MKPIPQAAMLLLITLALPCEAEIYKWIDENGKIHFSDTPHEDHKVETLDIEPAVIMGSVVPSSSSAGTSLLRRDINKQKAAKRQSIANAEQGRRNKENLRNRCENLKAQAADYSDLRNNSNNKTLSGYYEGRMAILNRKASEACKLSNFR